jgi:hypothetical protein
MRPNARVFRDFGLLMALLSGASCSSDTLLLPAEGDPGNLEVLAGNGQVGTVAGSLPESLVVRLTDTEGRPIANQPIAFVLTGDETGQLAPDTVLTDASGRAAARWMLGTVAGVHRAEARVMEATIALAAVFSATANPAAPDTLVTVSGDHQTGQVTTELAESLVVRLVDQFGNAVSGADVQWSASSGSISSTTVTTGPDGRAAVSWTLGVVPGGQQASATYPGVNGSPAIFSASATIGPPPRLVVLTEPSNSANAGIPFNQQPRVQAQDNLGNPILQSGVSVTATVIGGGGLGGGTTVQTNGNGIALFADLSIGGLIGLRTLLFAAPGHTSASSGSITLRAGPPSPTNSVVTVSPGTITASTGSSSSTIDVTAQDAFGNPVGGVDVVFASSGTGNTLTQPQGVTSSAGLATGFLSSTVAEPKSITATMDGIAAAQAPVIVVNAAAVSPATSTAVVPAGKIFQPTIIVVTARDQFGNQIGAGGATVTMQVSGRNPRNTLVVTDNGDGTYTASYTPFGLGFDSIMITLNGTAIFGSPYGSTVGF